MDLEKILTDGVAQFNIETQTGSYKGKLGNLKVWASPINLKVQGSLAKYHFGNNLETLTRASTKEVLERISNRLGIDIRKASVSRLDIAANLNVKRPVIDYLNCMVKAPSLNKSDLNSKMGDSLYFYNQRRKILFYDKLAEMRSKKQTCLNWPLNQNILRFELALLKQPKKQLKLDSLLVESLYQEDVYNILLEAWMSAYLKVEKVAPFYLDWDCTTGRELINSLALAKVQEMGVAEAFKIPLTQYQAGRAKSDQKFKMNQSLHKLIDQAGPSPCDGLGNLIEELDQQVLETLLEQEGNNE